MRNWFKARFSEGSTYSGLGAIAAGAAMLTGSQSIGQLADSISQGGALAAAGQGNLGIAVLIAGLLGVVLKDKGDGTGK